MLQPGRKRRVVGNSGGRCARHSRCRHPIGPIRSPRAHAALDRSASSGSSVSAALLRHLARLARVTRARRQRQQWAPGPRWGSHHSEIATEIQIEIERSPHGCPRQPHANHRRRRVRVCSAATSRGCLRDDGCSAGRQQLRPAQPGAPLWHRHRHRHQPQVRILAQKSCVGDKTVGAHEYEFGRRNSAATTGKRRSSSGRLC